MKISDLTVLLQVNICPNVGIFSAQSLALKMWKTQPPTKKCFYQLASDASAFMHVLFRLQNQPVFDWEGEVD